MNRNTEFLSGVQRTFKLYEDRMKKVGNLYGLTAGEVDVVSFLRYNPGRDTAADMVELRKMSKGGVSKAVEALIQKGLLQREQDKEDRRKIHLRLLPQADKLTQEIERERTELWRLIFGGFSQEEIEGYLAFTDRIFANISHAEGREEL